jgi:transposase
MRPPHIGADGNFNSAPVEAEVLKKFKIHLNPKPKRHYKHKKVDKRRQRRNSRRWIVERCFGWLKGFRRLRTRFERKAANFFGFVLIAATIILLRGVL